VALVGHKDVVGSRTAVGWPTAAPFCLSFRPGTAAAVVFIGAEVRDHLTSAPASTATVLSSRSGVSWRNQSAGVVKGYAVADWPKITN
jgi:hypothetical protein